MPEQVQKIWNQIVEWWKKFNTKQKVLLGSIAATLVLALAILAFVVSTPTMVTLIECENTAQAGEVKALLDGDGGVDYEMSQDGLIFYVNEKDEATASILLGQNSIPTKGYSIENVVDRGFGSTEADKTKLYKLYLEEHFAEHLETLSNVEEAYVTLDIPNDDGTILAREQDAYAAVILSLSEEMSEEQAFGIAQYIATQLGNDTTDNILILDSDSNVLYSGADSDTAIGTASTQLSLRAKTENMVKSEVKDVLVGSGLYDHAEVATKLDMDFDQYRETERQYSAPEGQTNGMIGEQS
ncbi:MAG: flagellar biosynthesis protein, partial [Clostridiales bacterium]|nr:flagellar biosynthesis protein [Clostridiales bacterium]MDY4111519.1 flagellar biosynthesis protein [Roseburia sp.]